MKTSILIDARLAADVHALAVPCAARGPGAYAPAVRHVGRGPVVYVVLAVLLTVAAVIAADEVLARRRRAARSIGLDRLLRERVGVPAAGGPDPWAILDAGLGVRGGRARPLRDPGRADRSHEVPPAPGRRRRDQGVRAPLGQRLRDGGQPRARPALQARGLGGRAASADGRRTDLGRPRRRAPERGGRPGDDGCDLARGGPARGRVPGSAAARCARGRRRPPRPLDPRPSEDPDVREEPVDRLGRRGSPRHLVLPVVAPAVLPSGGRDRGRPHRGRGVRRVHRDATLGRLLARGRDRARGDGAAPAPQLRAHLRARTRARDA